MFERFQQIRSVDGASVEKAGSGLGLTIRQAIVQARGGGIWAESELGIGSRFKLKIPLQADFWSPGMAKIFCKVSRCEVSRVVAKILYVEDDHDLAMVVADTAPNLFRCANSVPALAPCYGARVSAEVRVGAPCKVLGKKSVPGKLLRVVGRWKRNVLWGGGNLEWADSSVFWALGVSGFSVFRSFGLLDFLARN